MHTLLDLHGNIPTFLHISDGKLHDVNILDLLPLEARAFYIMDRAYLDFERLYRMSSCGSFFVLRAKSNTKLRRLRSNPVDRSIGLICDQVVKPNGKNTKARYPENLQRIKYRDSETGKTLVFLTNNFLLPPETIVALYKSRWQIELFFKCIKQHLRTKSFSWYFRECSKEPNLDCYFGLCAYCDYPQTSPYRRKLAHNSTDFEPYHV